MVTRIITILLFSFLVNSCWEFGIACEDDDRAVRKQTEVLGLLFISPLQNIYTKGDTITFSSYLSPSEVYFQEYFWGRDYKPHSEFSVLNFITDNEFTVVKGFINEYGQIDLEYNKENNSYELEIQIRLLRTGQYLTHSHDRIMFKGEKKCDLYTIDTSIVGSDQGYIKFYVEK